jgi:hypothetical protein
MLTRREYDALLQQAANASRVRLKRMMRMFVRSYANCNAVGLFGLIAERR